MNLNILIVFNRKIRSVSILFRNHSKIARILRDKELPIFESYEFDFFRCVNVEEWVFGKNVS